VDNCSPRGRGRAFTSCESLQVSSPAFAGTQVSFPTIFQAPIDSIFSEDLERNGHVSLGTQFPRAANGVGYSLELEARIDHRNMCQFRWPVPKPLAQLHAPQNSAQGYFQTPVHAQYSSSVGGIMAFRSPGLSWGQGLSARCPSWTCRLLSGWGARAGPTLTEVRGLQFHGLFTLLKTSSNLASTASFSFTAAFRSSSAIFNSSSNCRIVCP
jgi:hypothetical protein